MRIIDVFREIDVIVAVGSIDGLLTTSGVLHNAESHVKIVFCKPQQVGTLDPIIWGSNLRILFINLAVSSGREVTTEDFLLRIIEAGHKIKGVLDEHNRKAWQRVFKAVGLSFNSLLIKPVSQNKSHIKSSGRLLLELAGKEMDSYTRELCEDADKADHGNFNTHFGGLVNKAIKSDIKNNKRRVYLAKHFAFNRDPDEQILGWIKEYDTIVAHHQKIIESRSDLGDKIVQIDLRGEKIDRTTLKVYLLTELGYKVLLIQEASHSHFICRQNLKLDMRTILKENNIDASNYVSRFSAKVGILDKKTVIDAVRYYLILQYGLE